MTGLTIGSLFAGIGGFDLAGEWCGNRTIWTSEIDPFCVALLAERFPAAKQLGDITAIDWSHVERPDILTGGFPCQDISYAGKGAGLAGKRSGLWYEYARAIREVGPRYVIVENVRALFTRGFDSVLGTLADLGYDAEWSMYGAADVGAPHRRHRVWILAYARCAGVHERRGDRSAATEWDPRGGGDGLSRRPRQEGSIDCGPSGGRQAVRHPSGVGFGGESRRGDGAEPANGCEVVADTNDGHVHSRDEIRARRRAPFDGRWWAAEPDVGRVAYGVPSRLDRLRGLGNAIVPACALPIYGRIGEIEAEYAVRVAA